MHYLREYTSTHAITYSPSICVVSWILNRGIIDDARLRITWTRQDLQSGWIVPKYTTLIFRSMKFIKKGETIFECTSSRIPSANRETRNNGARIENICETVMNKLLNARLYTQRRHRKARQTDGRASMWADGYCLARETRGRETPLFLYYSPPTSSDHVQRLSRVPRERSSAVNSGYFVPSRRIYTNLPSRNGRSGIKNNVPSIITQIPGVLLLIIPNRSPFDSQKSDVERR